MHKNSPSRFCDSGNLIFSCLFSCREALAEVFGQGAEAFLESGLEAFDLLHRARNFFARARDDSGGRFTERDALLDSGQSVAGYDTLLHVDRKWHGTHVSSGEQKISCPS